MKGLMRNIRVPLSLKFFSIIFIFILLPLSIGLAITYKNYTASIERNASKYQEDVLREATINLDHYLKELSRLSTTPYQNSEVLTFIESSRTIGQKLSFDEREILDQYASRMLINGQIDIAGFSLYGVNGARYMLRPISFVSISDDGGLPEDIVEKAKKTSKTIFTGPHYVRSTTGIDYKVISAIRKLRSLEHGQKIGYIIIDIEYADFEARIEKLERRSYESIAITDEAGTLIYASGNIPIEQTKIVHNVGAGTNKVTWDGEQQLLTFYTSELTGWKMFRSVPMSILLADSQGSLNTIIYMCIVFFILATFASAWLAYRITTPISSLRTLMKKVERGDLKVFAPVRSRDEVGELSRTFNIMVSRLSELGYLLYESEIREKHAQLAALQSQINPHFLYNTLGSISMYAEIQNSKEIATISTHLGKLLRYSVHNEKHEVLLQHELMHVRDYMSIQKIRYEERVKYEIDSNPLVENCRVIRLILQPIVENSFIHGFDKSNQEGYIKIVSNIDKKNTLVITITDNSIGMSAERLAFVRNKLDQGKLSEGPNGNGLVNVHRRIILRYGNKYGLTIQSEQEQGTTVMIRLPLLINH